MSSRVLWGMNLGDLDNQVRWMELYHSHLSKSTEPFCNRRLQFISKVLLDLGNASGRLVNALNRKNILAIQVVVAMLALLDLEAGRR